MTADASSRSTLTRTTADLVERALDAMILLAAEDPQYAKDARDLKALSLHVVDHARRLGRIGRVA